mmetsp:Transcript_5526/g.34184  ORF Transcript_5526/g.34184 Transcript_5526/m.34184 type:complete len:305 (+) Transcript_5526:297-1211(+)
METKDNTLDGHTHQLFEVDEHVGRDCTTSTKERRRADQRYTSNETNRAGNTDGRCQRRTDVQNMKQDPTRVTGSGYIQFPPQRPFERPVQAQPPTLSQYEYPEAYGNGNIPAAQGYAASYLPPQTRPMTTTNLQPQQQQQQLQQPRYTHHAPPNNVQQRTAVPMQAPMRPPTHKVPPMQPTRAPTRVLQKNQGHQIATQPTPHAKPQEHPYKTQRPMQKAGHTRPTMQPESVPHPTPRNGPANPPGSTAAMQSSQTTLQALAPPPAETPSAPAEFGESKAKLSKSQAKRMRKKMRESQGVAGNL